MSVAIWLFPKRLSIKFVEIDIGLFDFWAKWSAAPFGAMTSCWWLYAFNKSAGVHFLGCTSPNDSLVYFSFKMTLGKMAFGQTSRIQNFFDGVAGEENLGPTHFYKIWKKSQQSSFFGFFGSSFFSSKFSLKNELSSVTICQNLRRQIYSFFELLLSILPEL